ncbi:Slp family lipoprotein [Agaribacter flavus]|uniref:Slp family lipoprotein n=1 Tax=Agaribacter flavus TaxID=1902781 RepID=A0ABV7FMS6_9ALTE
MKTLGILICILGLSACSTIPQEISVNENAKLIHYTNIDTSQASPTQKGELARWGGKIVGVENKKDVSEIEVVLFPEGNAGKPNVGGESPGRFKAVVEGFVDPLVFETDRLITVVGKVGDFSQGLIGEQNYTYPTVDAVGYYMWKKTEEVQVDNIGFSPFLYSRHYRRNFFNPWYDPFGGHRERYRVIYNGGHSQGKKVVPVKPTKPVSPRVVQPEISEPKPTWRKRTEQSNSNKRVQI